MKISAISILLASIAAVGCSSSAGTEDGQLTAPVTSNVANFVDFEFDGEVVAEKGTDARKAIVTQLFYTIGALTEVDANSRVGSLLPTSIVNTEMADGLQKITYHAKLPIAWPKAKKLVEAYTLIVPARSDAKSIEAFNDAYDGTCGKNHYGRDTFWHDFNPQAADCKLKDADIMKREVTVKAHESTTGVFPEYDQIWDDDHTFKIVAVVGANSGTGTSDLGYRELDQFVKGIVAKFPDAKVTENKTTSSLARDVTVEATFIAQTDAEPEERKISFTGLFVSSLQSTGDDFDKRYNELSADADYIAYDGHSELSKNTTAMGKKGTVTKGKYQIFFIDSCDSYAYLSSELEDRRIAVNGSADDPKGTKYLDVVSNVLPASYHSGVNMLAIFERLVNREDPKTYNEILESIPSSQIAVVVGEEDNVFKK